MSQVKSCFAFLTGENEPELTSERVRHTGFGIQAFGFMGIVYSVDQILKRGLYCYILSVGLHRYEVCCGSICDRADIYRWKYVNSVKIVENVEITALQIFLNHLFII